MQNKFNFDEVLSRVTLAKENLPRVLAETQEHFFSSNFEKQGFQDNGTLDKWKEVKRRIEGTSEYKYPLHKDLGRRTRPILKGKGTGALRRAVNNSIKVATFKRIVLSVEVPYATYHNNGTAKIPQRKFMGRSSDLDKLSIKKIKQFFDKVIKN